jgi:hypothetical protein
MACWKVVIVVKHTLVAQAFQPFFERTFGARLPYPRIGHANRNHRRNDAKRQHNGWQEQKQCASKRVRPRWVRTERLLVGEDKCADQHCQTEKEQILCDAPVAFDEFFVDFDPHVLPCYDDA